MRPSTNVLCFFEYWITLRYSNSFEHPEITQQVYYLLKIRQCLSIHAPRVFIPFFLFPFHPLIYWMDTVRFSDLLVSYSFYFCFANYFPWHLRLTNEKLSDIKQKRGRMNFENWGL